MADENLNINIDITADASEAKEAVSELKDSVNESSVVLDIDIANYQAIVDNLNDIKVKAREMLETFYAEDIDLGALDGIINTLNDLADTQLSKLAELPGSDSISQFSEILDAFRDMLSGTAEGLSEVYTISAEFDESIDSTDEDIQSAIANLDKLYDTITYLNEGIAEQYKGVTTEIKESAKQQETIDKNEIKSIEDKKAAKENLYKEDANLENKKKSLLAETRAEQLKLDSESKRAANERIAEAKANNLQAQQIYTEGKNTREEDLNAQRIASEEQKRLDSAKVASAKAAAEEQRKLYLQNKDTREKEIAERKKQLDEETKAEKDAAKAKADADKKAKEEQKEAAKALKEEQEDLKKNVDNVTEAFDRADAMSTVLFSKAIDLAKEAAQEVFELTKKSIEMGEEFEYIIDKVSTLSGDIYDENAISNEVKRIAETYGKSASDVAEAVYDALSSGISEQEVFGGIDAAAKLSVAGFTDVQTALEGLVSVLNAYSMSADNATDIANKFVIAQDLGRAEIGDLAKDIGSLAPTAQLAGVQVEEMLAAVAAVSATVGNSAETMTQINAALSNVIKPTEKAKKLAQELNLEFSSAAIKEKGFLGFIDDVAEKTQMNEEAIATLFGNIRGFRALASLTTEKGQEIYEQYNEALASGINKLDENFQKVSDNLSVKTDILKAKLGNIGIDMYDLLSSGLKDSVDNITVIVEGISEVFKDPSIQKAVTDLGIQLSDSFADVVKSGFDIDTVKSIVKSILEIISNIDTAFGSMFTASASIFADLLVNITSLLEALTSLDSGAVSTITSFVLLTNVFGKVFNNVFSAVDGMASAFKLLKEHTGDAILNILSMKANIAALAASAIIIITLKNATDAYNKSMDEFNDKYADFGSHAAEIDKLVEGFNNAESAANANKESLDNNAAVIRTLWEELQTYVDEQGNVISNQDRVNALINILNSDYGQTIELQNGIVQNYSEMRDSVYDYIEALEYQAKVEYYKPLYGEAVANKEALYAEMKAQQAEIEQMESDLAEYEQTLEGYNTTFSDLFGDLFNAAKVSFADFESVFDDYETGFRRQFKRGVDKSVLETEVEQLRENLQSARQELDDALTVYGKYEDIEKTYVDLMKKPAEEIKYTAEELTYILNNNVESVSDNVNSTIEEGSSDAIDTVEKTADDLKKIQADYLKGRQRALDDAYDAEKSRRDKELALLKQDNEDAYKEQERIWSNAEYVRKKAYDADLENLKNTNDKLIDERKKYLDTDYTNFKREKDDEYTLQERNAKDLIDSEIQIAEARIDSVKKYFDNKKKLEDKSYNETIKRLEAQKNAEFGIIDAEAEARKRKQKEDEIAKIESELAQYGDLNKLLTSADIKAYKDLEQKLIDKRTELADYDYEQDLKKRKENAEEKYKIEKEAEEKRHKEELERISERSTSQIDSLKAALEQNKTEWNRSLEDSKTAWKRAQEDELQALKDKNTASLEDYKATLKAQEDALKEENDALIAIFKIHLDDEKTEYKRMQQEKYDEAKEINEAYLKDLKRQNSDVIDDIKDKQSEALKLFKENADTLTDPSTGFLVVLNNQADTLTESIDDSASAVDNLATSFNNVLTEVDDVKYSLEEVDRMLNKGVDLNTVTIGSALVDTSRSYSLEAIDAILNRGVDLNTLTYSQAPVYNTVNQNINYNAPVVTPDIAANDIKNATTYGLNSANRR